MKLKIHHIGIVTKNVEEVIKYYSEVFGLEKPDSSLDKIQKVDLPGYKLKYGFVSAGNALVEFLEPIEGPWVKRLKERGEGSMWELCFEVDDIEEFYDEMMKKGINPVDRFDQPLVDKKYISAPGSGAKFFYLDRSKTYGTWIEILEPERS